MSDLLDEASTRWDDERLRGSRVITVEKAREISEFESNRAVALAVIGFEDGRYWECPVCRARIAADMTAQIDTHLRVQHSLQRTHDPE